MVEAGWARSRGSQAEPDGLRRGAWYRVVDDIAPDYVVLDVNQVQIRVAREHVQLRGGPPTAWSVVQPSRGEAEAHGRPSTRLREPHFVCPRCHTRYHLVQGLQELKCLECQQTYPIEWQDLG